MKGISGEKIRGAFGDSLLVVADEGLVKVHIHSERPGDALNFAQEFGDLTNIKIENMREQHAQWAGTEAPAKGEGAAPAEPAVKGAKALRHCRCRLRRWNCRDVPQSGCGSGD